MSNAAVQPDLFPWARQPPRAYELCPGWPAGAGVYRYRAKCLGVTHERVSAMPLIAALIGPEHGWGYRKRGYHHKTRPLVVLAWCVDRAEINDAVVSAARTGGHLCVVPTERRRDGGTDSNEPRFHPRLRPPQETSTPTQYFADDVRLKRNVISP
jgi:hypothetical protein